ncbi:uncharacterized protein LOC108629154 isoform X2 [Ceratina calcarata]|uniref:Uncharacterized protein LOC108629154 isoform X2 n=1 Tax=Ceratina calcarata TaxID=156304 RepID=A0AAJ7J8M4_9HYME|nr:uncharacterized protein LOC108629154 isoform X2 [Ceratina calcarata]
MNYNGNMPDWHQYNTSQTNEVTLSTQNVNSGHLSFVPSVGAPPLNAINLNSEGLNKHQNNTNFNPRNYQSYNNVPNGPNIPNNNPLASMVQMQNCIGHYGPPNTRNPVLDNINASVDPRNTTVGNINDEAGYRNNQVPYHGAITHLTGSSCNLNTSSGPGVAPVAGTRNSSGAGLGTNPGNGTGPGPIFGPGPRHGPVSGHGSGSGSGNMGPRNANMGSVPPGKSSASFIPCKGLCCNSEPTINYQQWEKFGSYQNNTSYRDNVHPPNYQMENRHFGNNCNFRKDNLDGKEVMGSVLPNTSAVDHRRNFVDYKYHKDHLMHRNYSNSSGMFHNYPMQGYNYSAEHQKYAYPSKEHMKTNNMNIPNSEMVKHQEQNFMVQQKFNNKQFQYQNGNMLPKGMPGLNVNANITSSTQNPYFNSQFPRNVSTEMSHERQETTDNTAMPNRMPSTLMHSSPPQQQVYQHKIAMQKFSIENCLNELSRIPGYQSHPKYKECVLKYREVLKLQQSSGYQNPIQSTSRVATPVNTTVPPINLQFDQNGMLINSSYLSDGFTKLQPTPIVQQATESIDKQNKDHALTNETCQQSQSAEQLMISSQNEHVPSSPCAETFQNQNQFSMHKDFNQNQLKVQTSKNHNLNTLSDNNSNETMMQQKASKELANKPVLDVRQFLANWDETDDEEETTNLPNTVLSETTPVVVVSYENVDLSSKRLRGIEASRRKSFCSNEALENEKEDEANLVTAEGLTISYSSPVDDPEITKTSKRTIGEGVVKPGSIIHCISNGPDEIPTIHIVDNLEISNILGASNDQVIQTLEKQKTISFFRESSSNETEAMALESTEQQDKSDTNVLPANYGEPLDDVNKEEARISESMEADNQELETLSETAKTNLDASDNVELEKQRSFEESHNTDDISLPDLPTSECTPISTTLNTPIQSDSEESSENIEDLSISTNPIEVMQNSPVISFTQLSSDEEIKNRTLGSLALGLQKENRYKSDEGNASHEQEITLHNFDFSVNPKSKSNEIIKNKQLKSLGLNTVKKKVFLSDGKESESRISNTCGILTPIEYELEVQQETVNNEKNLDGGSPACTLEERNKDVRRSRETIKTATQRNDSIENLSPIESSDEIGPKNESDYFRKKKMKILHSTNATCSISSEIDSRKARKSLDKNSIQKKTINHSRPAKGLEVRKFNDPSSSQAEEKSVCHMTSRYKHYSVAVIKDNATISDKRSYGTTDRIPGREKVAQSNTGVFTFHETFKLLQKDLKAVDGDVKYTAEEIRLLKEYRKKKEKFHQAHDTQNNNSKDNKIKCRKVEEQIIQKADKNSSYHRNKLECSQLKQNNDMLVTHKVGFEENSVVSVHSQNVEAQKEGKSHLGRKNQEHAKDSMERIKIEINVSCTDRSSKEQEQNRRLLYDDRSMYKIDDSPSYSDTFDGQRRLNAKDQEEKTRRISEKFTVAVDVTEANKIKNDAGMKLNTSLRKGRRTSLDTNEECNTTRISKDTCDIPLDSQSFNKSKNAETVDASNCGTNHVDIIKSKSAISNTAIINANVTKFKGNKPEGSKENDSTGVNDDRADVSSKIEKKSSKKLPESNLIDLSAKPLNNSDGLDLNLDTLVYKNARSYHLDEKSEENGYTGKWKKPKIDDIFEDCNIFQSSSGYVNPIFSSIDKLEDLHTVPVYTTKDGKISYSPNRRFTYHELMMEARKREASSSTRKYHYADTWNSYYNSKFHKLYKKKRQHGLGDKKKHEYKNTKYIYDRKKNYSDEFYSKSHVKYKDCFHSIRNNNAVWSDHMKMYSSSDSDEIIDRNKNQIAEENNFEEDQDSQNKTVIIKSHKGETIHEIDLNNKDNVGDNILDKHQQPIQSQIFDADKENETYKNANNNNAQWHPPVSQPSNNDKDNTDCIDKTVSAIPESLSENLINNESKNLDDALPNTVMDIVGNEITEDQENMRSNDDLLISKLLKDKPSSDEDKQVSGSCNLKEKTDDKINSKEIHIEQQSEGIETKKLDETDPPESRNSTRNVGYAESSNSLETDKSNITEFGTEKETLELHNNFDDAIDKISKASSELESCNNASNAILEESEENINKSTILETTQENTEINEEIEVRKDDNAEDENMKKDIQENSEFLQHQTKKEDTCMVIEQKSESRVVQILNVLIDQKSNSDESVNLEDKTGMISEKNDNVIIEEQSFIGFSKDEICTISLKDQMEFILPDTEETSLELEVRNNCLANGSYLDNSAGISENETNSNVNLSVEEEMPVLEMCSVKQNSPTMVSERDDKEVEHEPNSLGQVSCTSSDHTDVKTVPKLIIKKTDNVHSNSECSLDCTDFAGKYDAKLLSDARPKIPKMIIMKSRSRSATPTIEILEKAKPDKAYLPEQNDENMDVDNSDTEQYTLKHNNYENKVPKVKIKLEEISSKDLKLYLKRKAAKKNIPKTRVKKMKIQESTDSSETEATDLDEEDKDFNESITSDTDAEKVPKLKLRRQEEERNRNSEKDLSVFKFSSKRGRKRREEDTKHGAKYDSTKIINEQLKKKFPQCILEKIPKVIIKRTQIGAEFKCEISKSKKIWVAETSKWQPRVKLQRLEVLDHMVKDLRQSKITINDKLESFIQSKDYIINDDKKHEIHESKGKLFRSNSVSDLPAVKYKQRRLSDFSCMKVDSKLVELNLNSEKRNINEGVREKSFFENREDHNDHNSENEKEIGMEHTFRSVLDNDLSVKREYSSFGIKEDIPSVEIKFLNSAMSSCNTRDNSNSIIEVDTSDESQTTIEILPASPDCSVDEAKSAEFVSGLNADDAIPTQLELELELMDNNLRSGMLASRSECLSYSKNKYTNSGSSNSCFNELPRSSQNNICHNSMGSTGSNDYFYCNDLLVKEVLTAKETLKKCLSRSENTDVERIGSRPRTVAEKKQGLSFSLIGTGKSSTCDNKMKVNRKLNSSGKEEHEFHCKMNMETVEERCSKREKIYSGEHSTASTCEDSSVPEPTTISLKASKKFGQPTANDNDSEESQEEKVEKKTGNNTEDQKDHDSANEVKTKEDNMPLLVPEFALSFDSSSDRDSSRSPPVITNPEENEQVIEDTKLIENKVINQTERVDENKKHSYKDCEMSITDIIMQLAYHEKATIKHKRYCNLCERWFPSTERHRQHLIGYQHRYMELSQRKSIHALFILFTGKPCPRLLPSHTLRSDCSIGELTPLQIAVQDVANCLQYTQPHSKTKE